MGKYQGELPNPGSLAGLRHPLAAQDEINVMGGLFGVRANNQETWEWWRWLNGTNYCEYELVSRVAIGCMG